MALTTTLEKKQNQTLSKSIEAQNTVEAALEALSSNKLNKTGKAVSSNTADKLANTTAIGSTIKPVYFTDKGVPAACTYKLEKDVPSNAVFTDTHHKTYLYVTGSTGTTNAQTSNGATHLRLFDETTNRSTIKITGTGATKVSSDSHGVITINSTDNNTTYSASTGLSLSNDNKFSLKTATASEIGGVKSSTTGTTANRDYNVQVNSDGTMKVNVPWTDTVYTHPTGSGSKHIPSGGSSGQILRWSADGTATWGSDNDTKYSAGTGLSLGGSNNAFSVKTGYTTNGKNYKVTTDSSGNLYVNVPWTDYGGDISALKTRMGYLMGTNPSLPPIIETNLVLSNELSITDTTILGQIYDALTYAEGAPRRTACMSFKDTGTGKLVLNFTVSIYKERDEVFHYLLVSYFKDSNGIYKVYLGFKKASGNFGHDAIKVEQYGTF